ncbi:type II toxin-antitoxin system HicB family antitoxin [Sphingomonas azotifigens]|uniref:type II toxin-antitoxin system HicB family antitoxin n=1 Tax=Sphingomonas azotifigens TaxID=330920 RepID=UPI0009FFBF09|nr:type II toxin-antitoxin system HicB family antitoxin [Sphingomonas azotifigens]
MSEPHYNINLLWSDEDGCWIADVPDLRYCTTHGDTPEVALANVREAIAGWLEAAAANGVPIPEPRYRPSIYAARFAA